MLSETHVAVMHTGDDRLVLPDDCTALVGERVIVTTSTGDTFAPVAVELDAHGSPYVQLPCNVFGRPRRAFVRRAP